MMTGRDPDYINEEPTVPLRASPQPNQSGQSGQSSTGTDQVQQSANAVTDQTRQAASQVSEHAKDAATSQLSVRKEQTARGLNVVSAAVSDMGDRLRQNQQTQPYARFADQASHQIQRMASYLESRDVRQIAGEAEDWVRRDPVLALGGAFALGLIAARFLKSSGVQTQSRSAGRSGYAPGYRYNNSYYQPGSPRGYPPNQYPEGNQYRGAENRGTTYGPADRRWNQGMGGENLPPNPLPEDTRR